MIVEMVNLKNWSNLMQAKVLFSEIILFISWEYVNNYRCFDSLLFRKMSVKKTEL